MPPHLKEDRKENLSHALPPPQKKTFFEYMYPHTSYQIQTQLIWLQKGYTDCSPKKYHLTVG